MLTDLDSILFPDECEVVEIPPHDRRIYLMYKNGSSSLREEALVKDWRIIRNQDLRSLHSIDVYLRDPVQRYLSGVNTFVQHLMRDNVDLDRHTCDVLATRYHFLNRHYLPQWHWLVNLARFIDPGCQIRFHHLKDLGQIIDRDSHAGIHPLEKHRADKLLESTAGLELWFLLDLILLGRCGQSMTWQEILGIYQQHPVRPLQIIQDRMTAVCNALC